MKPAVLLVIALAAVASCGGAQAFVCASDAECTDGSRVGTCEASGFCSFPDAACSSGARYGEHAGSGLDGECVDDGATSGIATTVDDSSPTTTTNDPTFTSGDPTSMTSSDPVTTAGPSTTEDPMAFCGNSAVEPGEQCDGDVDIDCTELGWDGGPLQCDAMCNLDESACTDCGNAILEAGEQCDTADVGDVTCEGMGFFAGEIACTAACELDVGGCHNCGNDSIDDGELCDGQIPMGLACNDLGLGFGALGCADCELDLDNCSSVACGIDPAEPIGECPAICDECEGELCIIACLGSSECAGEDIVCPPGRACYVMCEGSSSCANANVQCSDLYSCDVTCSGSNGCANLDLECGPYGACSLDCATGTNVCAGAAVTCGADLCEATCGASVDEFPEVNCLGPCACSECGGD